MKQKKLDILEIKKRIMDIGLKKSCGHIPSALSCAEVLCKLYNQAPNDIILLSKSHGALAQYVILNELGKLPTNVLESYYTDGGIAGMTTRYEDYGLIASTGSLGHGLAIGIGLAIGNPLKRVFVVLGDAECQEGSVLEALQFIIRNKIKNVIPIVDANYLGAWEECDIDETPYNVMKYYAVKGQGLGDKYENTRDCHYMKINQEIYDYWITNFYNVKKNEQKGGDA